MNIFLNNNFMLPYFVVSCLHKENYWKKNVVIAWSLPFYTPVFEKKERIIVLPAAYTKNWSC